MHPLQTTIYELLKKSDKELTINEIAEHIKVERHTAAKFLDSLQALGLCEYKSVGKAKLWSVTPSPLFNIISKDNPLSDELKQVLEQVGATITFRDPKHSILWSNKPNQAGKKCYEVFAGKNHACSGCDVGHAITHNQEITGTCEHHKVTGTQIKDKDGKIIALLNIRKPMRGTKKTSVLPRVEKI